MRFEYYDLEICYAIEFDENSQEVFAKTELEDIYNHETKTITAPVDCSIDLLKRGKPYYTAILDKGEDFYVGR